MRYLFTEFVLEYRSVSCEVTSFTVEKYVVYRFYNIASFTSGVFHRFLTETSIVAGYLQISMPDEIQCKLRQQFWNLGGWYPPGGIPHILVMLINTHNDT